MNKPPYKFYLHLNYALEASETLNFRIVVKCFIIPALPLWIDFDFIC